MTVMTMQIMYEKEIAELKRKLSLCRECIGALNPSCEDFHHTPSEYHEHDEECPVMKKFKEILE